MLFLLLIVVLLVEALGFSVWLDTGELISAAGAASWISKVGPTAVRAAVVFGVITPLLVMREKARLALLREMRVDLRLLAVHAILLAVFALLSKQLFSRNQTDSLTVLTWLATGLLAFGSLLPTWCPLRAWIAFVRQFRRVLFLSLSFSLLASTSGRLLWKAWDQVGEITLFFVQVLVHPVIRDLQVDAVTKTLTSTRFAVEIAPQCSGYEGMGLMLAFGSFWLWLNRRDYRFPRAFVLLPAAVVLMFLLNSFRIAALFLMGHFGSPEIALGGFHSQAGWIAFLLVSVSFVLVSRRLEWMSATACVAGSGFPPSTKNSPVLDSTTAALAPFLAILAASILTGALTAGFDYLYPLRLAAAIAAAWIGRHHYARLNWSVSWRAVAAGCVVLAVWLALERAAPAPNPGAPLWWILARILGATITVPVAEELAFRHFLLRRFSGEPFEELDPRRTTAWALLASSILFGLMHGPRWIAGSVAGVIFGLEYRRRGSIGDAVVAHAVANALLAAYVLSTGSWQLW